uniref:Ribosome-recycling factor, chloroplastic n=1 Tax=Fagus sylvatica TaxID=28930 RepID=A0A2N9GZT1_FAGSY
MATPFCPTSPVRAILQPQQNPPKALLFLRGSCNGGPDFVKCRLGAYSWSSAASYVRIGNGAVGFCGKPIVVRKLLQRRIGVVRAATMEEIQAEKSLIEKDSKGRMEKTIDTVRSNFNSIRTGRSNPAMLDKIEVEYYGSPVSLKSIAQISTPDANSLLVQPYDKSSLKVIEKAIVSSDLGITPNNDGEVIRLTLPQLTSERRKEKKLSKDNVKDWSSDLQKLTDEYMKKIDAVYKQKEKVIEYDFGYDRIVKNNACDRLCCCIFGLGPRRSIML